MPLGAQLPPDLLNAQLDGTRLYPGGLSSTSEDP